jgi:hypothetical protein
MNPIHVTVMRSAIWQMTSTIVRIGDSCQVVVPWLFPAGELSTASFGPS